MTRAGLLVKAVVRCPIVAPPSKPRGTGPVQDRFHAGPLLCIPAGRILSVRKKKTMKRSALIAALAASTLLAACERSPSRPAGNGSATNAPVRASGTATLANPFAADERAMSDGMMKAAGADTSDTWVKMMIEHHRGAIAMSKTVLAQSPSAEVRKMAETIITKQVAETAKLAAMLSTRPADPATMEPYHASMTAMDSAMMASQGANISEMYLRKMLAHHQGAVALSEIVLARTSDAKVKRAAATVKTDQAKEVRETEAMLAGQ